VPCFSFLPPPAPHPDRSLHSPLYPSRERSFVPVPRSTSSHIYLESVQHVLLVHDLPHLLPDGAVGALLPHHLLHLDEVVLLRAQNGPWAGNPDPSDKISGMEIIVLHGVQCDKGTCAAQTCLAVHCYRTCFLLCDFQELVDDLKRGNAAIGEVQLDVFYILLSEVSSIVGLVIESNDCCNFQFFKNGDVVVGCEGAVLRVGQGTLYLSTGLSEGELNATNLLGMIQLRSPFSIFS